MGRSEQQFVGEKRAGIMDFEALRRVAEAHGSPQGPAEAERLRIAASTGKVDRRHEGEGRPEGAFREPEFGEIPTEGLMAANGLPAFRVTDPKYQGLASEKGYSQEYGRIAKTKYSHEGMIDAILGTPGIKQGELATLFGVSVSWISRIMGSDAFQASLAKRREELTDPILAETLNDRLSGLAIQSLEVLAEKLAATNSADIALKSLDITTKALGFGARSRDQGNVVQNNFVVQMPAKASSEDWERGALSGVYNKK